MASIDLAMLLRALNALRAVYDADKDGTVKLPVHVFMDVLKAYSELSARLDSITASVPVEVTK